MNGSVKGLLTGLLKRTVKLSALTACVVVASALPLPLAPWAHLTPAAYAAGITYTVEPFDFDLIRGLTMSVTQRQLGGRLCPCIKIRYPADGWHNQEGVTAIANTPLRAGDTVMGFSLGSQVLSLYLAQNVPPPGVRFILLGDTFERNDQLVMWGQGVRADIANQVILVARQYDGWSDYPTIFSSPNYQLATQNAQAGGAYIHDYINARLDDPSNVVTSLGNITAILIPTQHLPLNQWRRIWGQNAQADQLDAQQRPLIDSAYNRPGPGPAQMAAATAQQVTTWSW